MSSDENVHVIQVRDIQPDPDNLRKSFDTADIDALAENILEIGQTDPIQVFVREEIDGRTVYDLFDGERRWRAAKSRGLKTLNAFIIPRPSENDLLIRKISRMMQTRDYSFQEQVTALEAGLKAMGVWDDPDGWANVAPKLGVKPEQLRERMRVVRLSPKLQSMFFRGELDYTVAQQLGRLSDHHTQEQTSEFITRNNLSNRFVTAKFMTSVIKNPDKPLIQVYDLARKELADNQFAKSRIASDIPQTLQDRINDYVNSILDVEKELERGARGGFFKEAFASEFEKARILGSLARLSQILRGFLDAVQQSTPRSQAELTGPSSTPLLKE